MDELKVENVPLHVIPVTEYDPFEAKFAASLYWLVFRATEDGEFENIPSQVTSPIQRDSEKRITVRPEVTEFLTNGEIYSKVCNNIFHGKAPAVGQWAIIQTLSRHGFYVVEEGDIAVTDSALQQKKPFRKSTHLALMDCLMSAFSTRTVSVQQVVQSVSKFSSFNASKELPFDLEDALLLWINKICASLNDNQLKKQRQHAEQLLQNQDKAKRFRFRRDQLQPKVQTVFPLMEDLLKDISDGQSLLGIVAFYHPSVISLEDIRFGTNLSTEDCVHNLDLFRSLCSQLICTSVLALKIEDLLYGSQAMKPNITALLAELFNVCEFEWKSPEIGTEKKLISKSDVDQQCLVANKENFTDNRSLSNPLLLSEKDTNIGHRSPRENFKVKNGQILSMPGQLNSSSSERIQQVKSDIWKSQSDSQVNSNSRLSFKSPFQLDFTVDDDLQQPPLNEPFTKQDEHEKDKENPFNGIFQRPVLVRDRKLSLPNTFSVGGSPRVTPRQEHSLLARRNKQKQRTLDLEEWDMQQEEVEELHLNDLQRSQSLSGLDKAAPVEPRQSFHAWREETGASLSDTNLSSSRNQRISLDFRPNLTTNVTQKGREGSVPQKGAEGIHAEVKSSGIPTKREEHTSQDSLSSVDSLNTRFTGDKPWESLAAVGVRDSYMSDISAKELSQFEEIEAKILAGKSVETPRTFAKSKGNFPKAPLPQEGEDELNTSVSSEDMNMFRLEVLQRLTEDKLRQIPDGAEMEDSDDPILLARSNAVSVSSNPPDQRAHLEVPDAPADDPSDQLSPIAETTEPLVSNPNSVTSANSTAPSSPCSPLDVAPFMPAFFTTSPASTLDRKSKRFSIKSREDMEKTLVGEEEDEFQADPEMSVTPRIQGKSGEKAGLFPSHSKSYEQLVRGSYTVGQVSVESAKAAGIPVIGEGRQMSEIGGSFEVASGSVAERTNFSTSASSDVFQSGKLIQTEADSSQDLSGFRPLILSSGGVETTCAATEAVDGRRDSLESSPAPSPSLNLGKRDGAHQEAALLARDMASQDSPNDVVIFERSLSNPPEENSNSKTGQTEQHNTETVTRSSTFESPVFDFNQDTVENYKINLSGDFRTYKVGAQSGLAGREVFKAKSPATSYDEDTAYQRLQDVRQAAHFGTYSKKSHKDEQEQYTDGPDQASDSSDGRPRHRIVQETHRQGVRDLRHSDGFSTFRKDSAPQVRREEIEANDPALDLRLSDGFTTFRKGTSDALSGSLTARSSTGFTYDRRSIEADRFSTFSRKQKDKQGHDQESVEGLHDVNASERSDIQQSPVSATPHSNKEGEGDERQAFPRGVEEVQTRSSGSSYITRSRTFRKTPDGNIVDDHVTNANTSSGHGRNTSLSSSGGKLSGQQTVVTNIRVSPEGAGSDNPHRISWTDEPEAGARLMRQLNASVDKKTAHENNSPTSSPRRRSSPRQTGRGSPGARISWLTAAKSGVGGQVMLNEKADKAVPPVMKTLSSHLAWTQRNPFDLQKKGCMQDDTRTKHSADEFFTHEKPHFMAATAFRSKPLFQDETSPWKQSAPVPPSSENKKQTAFSSRFLLNGKISSASAFTSLENEPKTFENPSSISTASERDTPAGGSIRDRIAALSAAASVSRLDLTPTKEYVTSGREQSNLTTGKGVAFNIDFQKATKPQPPPRVTSRFRTKDLQRKSACETRAINEREPKILNSSDLESVDFGLGNNREVKAISSAKFGTVNKKEQEAANNGELVAIDKRETGTVDNERGVVKDRFVAFEVGFDDEPQSKRAKGEPGVLHSPFLALKTRSNRKYQQKSSAKIQLQRSNVGEAGLTCSDVKLEEAVTRHGFVDVNSDERKRDTFTLERLPQSTENENGEGLPITTILNDLASEEELKQCRQQSHDDSSALVDETPLKRSTFTLESVSREIDNAIETYFPNERVNSNKTDSPSDERQESAEKRSTYTLDSVSLSIQRGADEGWFPSEVLSQLAKEEECQPSKVATNNDSVVKRGTFTLEPVSQTLQEGQNKGLSVSQVLLQLANKNELQSSTLSTDMENTPKRGTFTLDSVSQTLQEAEEKGLPTVEALHWLASEKERHLFAETTSEGTSQPNPQNRGTYTLDTVSYAIEEAVEKGIPVSVTLNHLAKEEKQQRNSHVHHGSDNSTGDGTYEPKRCDAHALSSITRDEFEATFEDALEQLEDCVTCDSDEEFPTSHRRERPHAVNSGKRGTYDLEDVSTSFQDGEKDGVPVVKTLEHLSKNDLSEDGSVKIQLSEERRGTYTLDEVSCALQTASEQGIPVVETLENLARNKETSKEGKEKEASVDKRRTYTLDEVSKSIEHAKNTGVPVIEVLGALAEDKPKSPLRLKIPDRGADNRDTYTLDEVSHTLEHAKQRGLPVVDALGHLTSSKDSPIRQTPDAVHRRQEKLINRKTYALASPLETIGEGTKLRLYDGSQKRMMSPISFHVKSQEALTSKPHSSENIASGLGVVQKLDYLTSACERLLEANAKEMARDPQRTESSRQNTSNNDSVLGSNEVRPESCTTESERNTYSLESVSLTIDDAKAKGIPVVETLKDVSSVRKSEASQRTNLMRLNSKSDSDLINDGTEKGSDRYTHSLENVCRTLEDAKMAGLPVIQALEELTNELAEFSLAAMSGDLPITQLGKDNRKRKRYSETAIKGQFSFTTPDGSPYPPSIRKAYSLSDVAFAVQEAFQSGTSVEDFLDDISFEKPAEPAASFKDVRPRSVDSGFVSSFSDNDISSQSFESPRVRANTCILDRSNEDLNLAKVVAPVKDLDNAIELSHVSEDSNRRTFTLDHMDEISRDIPVIEALEKLSNSIVLKSDDTKEFEPSEHNQNTSIPIKSSIGRRKSPPKPKRQFLKKPNSLQSNPGSFVIEFFDSTRPQQTSSKFQINDDKVEKVSGVLEPKKDVRDTKNATSSSNCNKLESTDRNRQVSGYKCTLDTDLVPTRDTEIVGLETKEPLAVSSSAPTRGRATWRPSGSVLDQIASLMDVADDCGISPTDVLNQITDSRSEAKGEIEELEPADAEDDQAVSSQLAYLRMQLDEKRRHIEAEKHRAQAEWEDQRRRLGQTAFWYVIGKAQGGQAVGEGPGFEALTSDKATVMKSQSQDQPRKPVAEFPDQSSPPIAWSSPSNSPLPASQHGSQGQQFETREFRLSDYPPRDDSGTNPDIRRPSSQPAVEASSKGSSVPTRPSSHDPAATRQTAPARKCWNVDVSHVTTPSPLVRPETAAVNMELKQETVSPEEDTGEIEVEHHTPYKKGLAMFIGDDTSPGSQCLTPEQERKRDKFLRMRQKKQEEDRTRKEAELEKKRKREEKQREKEMLQRMEEERRRKEELERQRVEQELRIREAQAVRVPDSFATFRRPGPQEQRYDANDDASSYFVQGPTQPSGFAEFSGPQCYVKPSGKSNRKIIVNAISYVCLSGTVNQDQKEKCLQAISESDGHHFMILFKDGLKFRGIYLHNLDNDQLFKVFGIGPRVVTSKMVEFLYKYNSGGKEFTKIPSKTLSISVDGFAIYKSHWNTGKPVVASKTASNLKRPPRHPQR